MNKPIRAYLFVYGNERRGLPSQHLLRPFEQKREAAETNGRLYARTVAFPAAVFDAEAEGKVIGELIEIAADILDIALSRLGILHGCTKKDDPGNLFRLREVVVRYKGKKGVGSVEAWAVEAVDSDRFGEEQLIEDGDWLAYRQKLSAHDGQEADPYRVSGCAVPAHAG